MSASQGISSFCSCIWMPFAKCSLFTLNSVPEFTRDDVANLDDVDKPTMASFGAKIIYVGTYGFEPQDDVLFTSRGIRLTAPSMKRPGELVVLNIHKHEVIRTVYHFSSKCCVIFLYVMSSCSEYVRDEIGMEPNGTKGTLDYYQYALIVVIGLQPNLIHLTFHRLFQQSILERTSWKTNHNPTRIHNRAHQFCDKIYIFAKCSWGDNAQRSKHAAQTSDLCCDGAGIWQREILIPSTLLIE